MTNLFAKGDFMRKQFNELDRDGDGFITEDDLKACISGHPVHSCAINVTPKFHKKMLNFVFSASSSDMIKTETGRFPSRSTAMDC